MDKEISNKKKKRTYLLRIGMMILTLVLIVLFVLMMALVSRIQGTGRVVNYAGLVRGKTQRIIKLENRRIRCCRMCRIISMVFGAEVISYNLYVWKIRSFRVR